MDKKAKILCEARKLAQRAKESGKSGLNITIKSGETSSLGKVVNTEKKADFFMKLLRSL